MADDAPQTADAVELDETDDLDKIVLYALNEAAEKLEQTGELEPFTVILHGENLYVETHPGENTQECYDSAMAAVRMLAHVLDAYVFVYDGYIDSEEGTLDAVIVERGQVGEEAAEAFALLYTIDEEGEGSLSFGEGIYDLGAAESFLAGLEVSDDGSDEDLPTAFAQDIPEY